MANLWLCFFYPLFSPRQGPGVKSRICPPYPQRVVKRRLIGAVCRNHRTTRLVPCRCLDGHVQRQKGGDLTRSYDKSPYTNGNVKKGSDTKTTPQKSSIKQRLRTDLGRSVGVTTATQLVWFTRFIGPNLPTHRNSRVIEDKNMQIVHYSDSKVANI